MAGDARATIRLRRVRDGDADALAAVWLDQAERYAALAPAIFAVPPADGLGPWLVEQLSAAADPDRRLVLVADCAGTAAGFVVAAVVEPHPAARWQMQRDLTRRHIRIEALAVRDSQQRIGVGSRLLRAVEDWARNRDAAVVSTQTFVTGPGAAFLMARGYDTRAQVVTKAL